MKLAYLPHGSPDCPLLLLSDCSREQGAKLRLAAAELASGAREVAVVDAGADCEIGLLLRVAGRDVGIRKTPPRFECQLTCSQWSNIAGLIEPFLTQAEGHQWLDTSGEVAWILSPLGEW